MNSENRPVAERRIRNGAAEHVAQSAPDRDGHVEPGEDFSPDLHVVEVRQDRRRDRPVGRLADADEAARQEETAESRREAGSAAREAPGDDPDADQRPARIAFGEPAEDGRADHVKDHEGHRKDADERELGLESEVFPAPFLQSFEPRRMRLTRSSEETSFDRRDDRREDLSIDEVEEIDEEKQDQRRSGTAGRRRRRLWSFFHGLFRVLPVIVTPTGIVA
jgi:hypothetical protein